LPWLGLRHWAPGGIPPINSGPCESTTLFDVLTEQQSRHGQQRDGQPMLYVVFQPIFTISEPLAPFTTGQAAPVDG